MSVRDRILNSVKSVDDLPTISAVVARLNEVIDEDGSTAADVAEVIAQDPPTMARVLKLLSSPLYAPRMPAGSTITVQMAVVRLGMEPLRDIVLSTSVLSSFRGVSTATSFDFDEFWRHSICVGLASQVLLDYLLPGINAPEECEAFLAGLCHDLGKIVLANRFDAEFQDVIELVEQREGLMIECERELLEIGHDEIGAALAESWALPEEIQAAIRWHHEPESCPDASHEVLVRIVQLADFVCNHQQIGYSGNARVPDIPSDSFTTVGIDPERIPDIVRDVQERSAHSALILSLDA
ncbi:MAG: HDOD domain-containing protein [Planctomycetes bacterium]|nr:HDOD domain-containing protein [Planctomycetota bacterium]